MILILDKINQRIYEIDRNIEVLIDPSGNPIILEDFLNKYRNQNKIVTGIIFKEDKSSVFLYKDLLHIYNEFAKAYSWFSFDSKTHHKRYNYKIARERMWLLFEKERITTIERRELLRLINLFRNYCKKHGYYDISLI